MYTIKSSEKLNFKELYGTMVELSSSVYDEGDEIQIPIVHATVAIDENVVAEPAPIPVVAESVDSPLTEPTATIAATPTTIEDDDDEEKNSQEESVRSNMMGAGTAAGIVGLLLGGPVLGLLLGFGTAYATKQDGPTGDVARAVGDIALVAKDKAQKLDDEHHLVDKGKKAASECVEKVKELDQTHHVVEKVQNFAAWSFQTTVEFTRRHNLIERSIQTVGHGIELLVENIKDRIAENSEDSRQNRTERN